MAMVDVVSWLPTGGPVAQVRRLHPKVGSRLAIAMTESWCQHHEHCFGITYF